MEELALDATLRSGQILVIGLDERAGQPDEPVEPAAGDDAQPPAPPVPVSTSVPTTADAGTGEDGSGATPGAGEGGSEGASTGDGEGQPQNKEVDAGPKFPGRLGTLLLGSSRFKRPFHTLLLIRIDSDGSGESEAIAPLP